MLLIWLFKCFTFQLFFIVGLTFFLMFPLICLCWVLLIVPAYFYESDAQNLMGESHDEVTPHWYDFSLLWLAYNQPWVPELAKFFDSEEEGEEEEEAEDDVFLANLYLHWGLAMIAKIRRRNKLRFSWKLRKKQKYFVILKKRK